MQRRWPRGRRQRASRRRWRSATAERGKRAARRAEPDELREALDTVAWWYRDALAAAVGAEGVVVHSDLAAERRRGRGTGPRGACAWPRSRLRVAPVVGLNVQPALAIEALFHRAAAGGGTDNVRDDVATVVGVVFQPGGKIYSFDPAGLELRWNERVICQTARAAANCGRIVEANHDVPEEELTGPLKRVIRRATRPGRTSRWTANRIAAQPRAAAVPRAVPAPRAGDEADLGGVGVRRQPLIFSYSARSGWRRPALQADLSERLHRRVDLRMVGPREAARLCGGGGLCGPVKCCNRFPSHESPITLKHGEGPGPPDEPWADHRPVRKATLLSGVRAPGVPIVPRPGARQLEQCCHPAWSRSGTKL